jgi:hypothetical protein
VAESDNLLTKLQDLLVNLIPHLNKFPHNQKFVLGDRIETQLLAAQEDCLRAYYGRDKRGHLRPLRHEPSSPLNGESIRSNQPLKSGPEATVRRSTSPFPIFKSAQADAEIQSKCFPRNLRFPSEFAQNCGQSAGWRRGVRIPPYGLYQNLAKGVQDAPLPIFSFTSIQPKSLSQ